MKKTLLTALLASLSIFSVRADLIWYEGFNYADGPLTNNSSGVWAIHSTSGANDVFVKNNRLEVSGNSSTNAGRQADVNRAFCTSSCTYTNGAQIIYGSFTVNCTNLPTAVINYFAHFQSGFGAAGGTQHPRIFGQQGVLPQTWRLGISSSAATPTNVFKVDLARDVDYQVVVAWNPTGGDVDGIPSVAARLWVNPVDSASASVTTGDATPSPATSASLAFRQAGGTTSFFVAVSNCAVATTFSEAATNVWSTNALPPIIVRAPTPATNFVGDAANLSAIAAGQGLGNLTYLWLKNGNGVTNPNGNTNFFSISSASIGDTGNYQMVATTPFGLSATSSMAFLWVTNAPVPPTILPTTNTTVTVFNHQNATLQVVASGPPPISYQWLYNNGPVGGSVSGDGTDTILITDVFAGNGNTGSYKCVASNPYGSVTSGVFTVTATTPPAVTIAQLRTMVDPVFFLPTNTTALWQVTGIVTTHTNITSTGNFSGYIQDGTAGINFFYGGATSIYPQVGDSVTIVGPLGHFNSLLELNLTTADPAHSIVTNSSGNPLPTPIVLAFNFTNNPSASNAIRFYQGALVTLTNVYFPAGFAGTNNFGSGVNVTVTNSAGEPFTIRVDSRVGDIIGKRVPPYGWTVTGPMGYFNGAATADRSAGFQLFPTRFADFVIQKPASITKPGANPVVTWEAGPNVPYSVLRADDVEGTYLEIATGLSFPTTAGTYTDTSATGTNGFYKITSP